MATKTQAPVHQVPVERRPTARRPRGRSELGSLRRLLIHLGLIAFAMIMIYPLLWMLSASFKPLDEIFSDPSLIPSTLEWRNYVDGWTALPHPFHRYIFNSTVIVAGAIIGNLVSCSMAAYAFARLQFPLRGMLFAIMLATIMLPIHVVIIPQYILFNNFGWINTFWPLIVPKLLATDAFFIFLMVQFIRGLPRELDEAAKIDGCSHWGVFLRVIMPLCTPALATTAIFTFIWTWNDFYSQLIYIRDIDLQTVPLALRLFLDSQGQTSWGALFAMSIVALGPIFGFFLAGQRYLVRGIATTGIK
ncbi:carbohydrate ABC transporter permease [Glycomyces sp. L485]|uniref:carbohydrate ABC transporter permease n=1 Tax=Glycomyces sp. L485 TaxID=2909235 RepID=UPI001F4AC527|nr:carbohydrate ABC transporter permease [Glycomyces sp. L485]MCH7230475.1 carbohydrate ABC transporter permease [Glycomyces sp. L485]